MKKICLLLALILTFCFVVGCTGADNNANDDDDAEGTRVKKNKETADDSECDTYYIDDTDSDISKNEYKNVKVGDYITFGSYEQDNNTSNGKEDIEWLVLDVQDEKALVISRYGLDAKPYNTEDVPITWENCTLRQWLNNGFINSAFTISEKSKIATTKVTAEKNPSYSTDPGNDTQDKIFLLSINEVNKYFSSDSARQCKPTSYAVANGAYQEKYYDNCCMWWLRSPGCPHDSTAAVGNNGYIDEFGYYVLRTDLTLRPALWIDLNA